MTRLSPGDTEPEASGETAEERMCWREGKAQGRMTNGQTSACLRGFLRAPFSGIVSL